MSDWVWPEIVAYQAIKRNNMQKGMDEKRAASEAWKESTFGFYDKGETEKQILAQAKKQGYSDKDIKNLETLMKTKKLEQNMKKEFRNYQTLSLNAKEAEGGVEVKPGIAIDYVNQAEESKQKLMKMNDDYEKLAAAYTGGEATYGVYDEVSQELMRTEWNKSLPGRQKRVDPYAGEIGSWLGKEVFTINPQERQAMQEQIDAMSPEELDKWNLQERGIGYERVHPQYGAAMSGKQMEPLRDQIGYMHPQASGGRAGYTNGGLTRTVAPDSGPVSQGPKGLAYLKKYGNYS